FWAMSIEPSHASSMRAKATRLLPSSTTAMFIGTPICVAFARAASRTAWPTLRVTVRPDWDSLAPLLWLVESAIGASCGGGVVSRVLPPAGQLESGRGAPVGARNPAPCLAELGAGNDEHRASRVL